MNVLVAISKRQDKHLAAAVIAHDPDLGWQVLLFTVVNGQAAPFGINPAESREAALKDANDTLQTTDHDWLDLDEDAAEQYILNNTRHSWNPQRK